MTFHAGLESFDPANIANESTFLEFLVRFQVKGQMGARPESGLALGTLELLVGGVDLLVGFQVTFRAEFQSTSFDLARNELSFIVSGLMSSQCVFP